MHTVTLCIHAVQSRCAVTLCIYAVHAVMQLLQVVLLFELVQEQSHSVDDIVCCCCQWQQCKSILWPGLVLYWPCICCACRAAPPLQLHDQQEALRQLQDIHLHFWQ